MSSSSSFLKLQLLRTTFIHREKKDGMKADKNILLSSYYSVFLSRKKFLEASQSRPNEDRLDL